MKEFSIISSYLENLRSAVGMLPHYKEQNCRIVINGSFNIDLPTVVAASISKPITRMLEIDPTMTEFKFNIPISGSQVECLEKIRSVLVNNQCVTIDNENDARVFATFGLLLGNNDFISPLDEKCKIESQQLTNDNVLNVLETKRILRINDTSMETDFIAANFEELSTDRSFLAFARKPENVNIVEQIISSNSLMMDNEDTLLKFLIDINRENANDNRYTSMFDHIFIEYCSLEKCEEFVVFANERAQTQEIRALVSCMGRRILQPNIPNNKQYIEGRHKPIGTTITNEDPLNGILRREHEKGNVVLEASSTCGGNVYDLIKGSPDADFITRNEENSNITASLKDGTPFVLTSYTIRGRKYDKTSSHLQSWRIEGQRASSGEWVQLDQHTNEPFDKLLLRTFDISSKEQLTAVRLVQEGKTTYDNYNLCINSFEVFGILFDH